MNPVTGLALGRIVVGIASLVAPDRTAAFYGATAEGAPALIPVSRMFGAREVALGLTTLLATGTARRNLVVAGMGVDGADTAAAIIALRSGQMPTPAAGALAALALGAVGAGAAGLRG